MGAGHLVNLGDDCGELGEAGEAPAHFDAPPGPPAERAPTQSVKPRRVYQPNTHVTQSHDPRRQLYSHVVQVRSKRQCEVQRLVGRYERTKAEMREDLRLALLRTAGAE